jgi:hypothetical protein
MFGAGGPPDLQARLSGVDPVGLIDEAPAPEHGPGGHHRGGGRRTAGGGVQPAAAQRRRAVRAVGAPPGAGTLDGNWVLLAAGASLLRVQTERLLPGLQGAVVGAAVTALLEERKPKWFHADEKGELAGGLPDDQPVAAAGRREMAPVQVVDDGWGNDGGALPPGGHSRLPRATSREIGWVGELSIEELTQVVETRRNKPIT